MALKQLANETLQLIQLGSYVAEGIEVRFKGEQEFAENNTRLYTPDELTLLRSQPSEGHAPTVQVLDSTTQFAADAMFREPDSVEFPLALLNFASARNPGGGFLNGAKAQEEDLCRCSGLYPCLLTCMPYYEANRQYKSVLYTDHAIYSPRVPFFKVRGTDDLLANPYLPSVITAPAPNTGPFLRDHPNQLVVLADTFLLRWENVICIAREQGVKRLLLGAWGCGAFGGDPLMASRTAKFAIERYGSAFERIVFAIPGSGRQSKANLDAFRDTLTINAFNSAPTQGQLFER